MYKELFAGVAILLTIMGFYPYIVGILRKTIQAHVFSWLIWALTTGIVFFAQVHDGAGVGAIPIGFSAVLTVFICIMAFYRRHDISITPLDWIFLSTALFAIPIWILNDDPMWAVILLTVIDLIGFLPTVRKIYHQPFSESHAFFALFAIRNLAVVGALQYYSITTALFPIAVALACLVLMLIMQVRRLQLQTPHHSQ